MNIKLTPHKIAQVDRLLSSTSSGRTVSRHRVAQRFAQGEAFGDNADSKRHHGYVGAWSEMKKRHLETI